MDIEGPEWNIIEIMDMDYACRYFKQFLLETHISDEKNISKFNFKHYELLKKLEKCFLLFHRDTRFYQNIDTREHGFLNEFQAGKEFDLRKYGANEMEVIAYMFSMGELYFVNVNFL